MRKIPDSQQVKPLRRKKIHTSFSRKSPKNVLENTGLGRSVSKPQTFRRKKRENPLELARTLCLLANAGAAAQKAPDVRSDREREWVAQALDLLNRVSPCAIAIGPITPETWLFPNPANQAATSALVLPAS